jgi:hypothetical protein
MKLKPTWLDVYYDKKVRSWCIQPKDDLGCQVADSSYVYSKGEAKAVEATNIEYYNIDPKHNRIKQHEQKEYLKSLQ